MSPEPSHRMRFLDYLDELAENSETTESEPHKALESNLWIFGRRYSSIASNRTLQSIVQEYCDKKYVGDRAKKRPDLLLSQDADDRFLLIEFKRPSHSITRDDVAQAEKYRDDLSKILPGEIQIIMIGKGRVATLDTNRIASGISINSYKSLIASARNELNWLLNQLKS